MSKRKNPSVADNSNSDFCDFLMELADYEKNVSRNIHKYNAYRKAASVLATHPKRIESGDEAKKLSGIGEKIAKKIDEFLQTGKLRKLENIHQDEEAQAISLLTRVSGIGPVKAAELIRSGIKSIEELRKNENKLTHHQLIGLKYFEDFEKKIPRNEIQEIEKTLKTLITNFDSGFTLTICGSYRRGKQESGDIDALVTHPSVKVTDGKKKHGEEQLKRLVSALDHLVIDTISVGETKFMARDILGVVADASSLIRHIAPPSDDILRLTWYLKGVCQLSPDLPARRLDIRLIPLEQYHCAVLYFTGSDVFNKTMRSHALEHNFTLNEYSLRPVGVTGVPGEPVPISSEEDIFDYIDFPYKKPEERNM